MSKPRLTIYDTKFFRIATPEGKVIPVVLRSESHERGDISELESINVYAQNSGQNVPLTQVADIIVAFEPSRILRRDRSKALTVSSELDERAGVTVFDVVAELEAGQQRVRPILLTTATAVGGLLPLWLGEDPLFAPMAVAIMFGLVFVTVLTLGLVPALYAVLLRMKTAELTGA